MAHREYLRNLRLSSSSDLDYHQRKADRSICPRRQDFNRLYADFCKEKYGARNGKEMFDSLNYRVAAYQEENPESTVEFQRYEENGENITPFILTIVTPLMKRVHLMVYNCSYNSTVKINALFVLGSWS